MSGNIHAQDILDALQQVPEERWGRILTFIESLRTAEETGPVAKRPLTAADLLNSDLIGIWADRSDIGDSREFARKLREQAQRRDHER